MKELGSGQALEKEEMKGQLGEEGGKREKPPRYNAGKLSKKKGPNAIAKRKRTDNSVPDVEELSDGDEIGMMQES
jgi:hypothetical protein